MPRINAPTIETAPAASQPQLAAAHVALNTLTNYVNEVAGTIVDFPAVSALKAA